MDRTIDRTVADINMLYSHWYLITYVEFSSLVLDNDGAIATLDSLYIFLTH